MRRDPVYRQDAPGYLGMVRETEGLRVIVADSPAGRYYRLQVRGPSAGQAPGWVPVDGSSSPTLAKLLHKCAVSAPGLRELVKGLPDDPAKAAPWWWAIRDAHLAALSPPFVTNLKPPLV